MGNTLYAIMKALVLMLSSNLTPEQFREWADIAIEAAKKKILESETQADDDFLLPFIEMLDKAFGKTDDPV